MHGFDSRVDRFDDVLVGVPTYCEAGNAPRLVTQLRQELPGATILVIDDASPDGTGDLIAAMAQRDPLIRLLRRPGKLGLGTAYTAAFDEGRRTGVRVVLTLDADFSHRPQDAPGVVREALRGDTDLAIGSRYVPRGAIVGWPRTRRVLSATANRLIRMSLVTDIHDCTGSFRAYRMDLIQRMDLSQLRGTGYSALPELLLLAIAAGARIREVPITFVERERGVTKLTRRELLTSLISLVRLRRRRLELARCRATDVRSRSASTTKQAGRLPPDPGLTGAPRGTTTGGPASTPHATAQVGETARRLAG